MNNWRAIGHKYLPFIVLAAYVVFLVWRAPNLFITPRFWGEETHFFSFAFSHTLLGTLFFVYFRIGYLNFIVNLGCAIAAKALPLEYAPFGTTYLALLIQIIPAVIVIFGRSTLFSTMPKKIAGCMIFLFSPSAIGEVWVNTINSQTYFGLIALLILLADLNDLGAVRKWAYRLLLALGGISGIYVLVLQPVFLLRAYLERNRERYVQLSIVTAALLIQAAILGVSLMSGRMFKFRTFHVGLQTLKDISFSIIGISLFNNGIASWLAEFFGRYGSYSFLLLFIAALPVLLYDKEHSFNIRDSRTTLFFALVILLIVSSFTALAGRVVGRYAVLPGYVLLLLVLANIRMSRHLLISAALSILLLLSLSLGAYGFRDQAWFLCDGRNWKSDVEMWRQNPDHEIRTCPHWSDAWKLKLPPPAK